MSWERTGIGLLLVLGLRAATFVMAQRGPVNVATGLPESAYDASSYYKPSEDPDTIRPASNAANGNTDGTYTASNCIHTDYYYLSGRSYKDDRRPWWQVQLDKKYYVYLIKVWARDSSLPRMYPFSISVDGNPCVSSVTNPQTREITVKCTKPIYGQIVRFSRAYKRSWDYTLNMCEFQILVCNPGYYGTDCDKECNRFCTSDGCLMNNGSCISCGDGYWGSQCENQCGHCKTKTCDIHTGQCADCEAGWYEMNCNDPCLSDACDKNQCDRQTGVCLACTGNLEGDLCNECKAGFFGDQCQRSCESVTPGCDLCERTTGKCTLCLDNYRLPDCTVCMDGYYKSDSGTCARCSSTCPSRSCDPESGKCNGCSDGYWGPRCLKSCPDYCERCDQDSGECVECRYFLEPPSCSDCIDGYYKQQRTSIQCSECTWTCLNGTICDKATGECPVCPPGKYGKRCYYDCKDKTYGQNCSQQCGHCFYNAACNVVNGECSRCKRGWQPPLCQEECKDGTFGEACAKQCGHCKDGAACNKQYGDCPLCDPGWYPPSCSRPCADGWYGVNCSKRCGVCLNGQACEKDTGHCACPAGKQPPLCVEDCQGRRYGKDCRHDCGHCKNDEVCDPVTGHCRTGCQPGWTDPPERSVHLCKDVCPPGFYGESCNQTCGNCQRNSFCLHDTGLCELGCAKGFTGTHCMKVVQKTGPSTAVIAGASIAVVFFIVIIAVVVVLVMRRKYGGKKSGGSYSRDHEELSNSRDGPSNYSDPNIINTTSLTMSAAAVSGKPQAQVKPIVTTKHAQSSRNNGAIYENVAPLPQKPAPTSSSAVKPKRGNAKASPTPNGSGKAGQKGFPLSSIPVKGKKFTAGEDTPVQSEDEEEDFDDSVYANEGTLNNVQPTDIRLDSLQESVLKKLQSGDLEQEFLRMVPKKNFPVTNGQREENYYKNRFNSILPYDKNRVELDQVDGDEASDYVNASFIKGHRLEKAYIAAQGPKNNTLDDFWRMVWQEGVTDIVMLTNLTEGAKTKCHQYWPADGASMNTAHMQVQGVGSEQRAHFIIRTFDVRQTGGKDMRRVTQYHYLSWLDHEVPSTTQLVNFWRYVDTRAPRSASAPPLVVHCSAGVGRTGTYIALDIVIAIAQEQTEINIYKVVDRLRDDRCNMVQNKGQYAFLHEAVLEAYQTQGSRLQMSDLDTAFPHICHNVPNQRIDAEFQSLCKMRDMLTSAAYTMASQDENHAKNRNPNILPDDKHMVFLTQHVKGRNQYINAVYMPTFLQPRGSIVTQLPLPDTMIDMWRLIDGCDISTVVALGDVEGRKDMCRYWPKEGEQLKMGTYAIMTQSLAQIGESLDSYSLNVHKDKGQSQQVHILHYKSWKGKVAGNMADLIQLLETLHSTHMKAPSKPIIVQCIDGAVHSGVFCALWDIISRMMCDGEVDVSMATRLVIGVRREAITSVEQYRFCYEVAQHYYNSQTVYANT